MDIDLINLVFKYFPRNLEAKSGINREIEATKEFHSLKQIISNSDHFKEESIISQISKIGQQKKLSFLVCDRKSIVYKRSSGIRFSLFEESKDAYKIHTDLVLALSLLTPVYFLEVIATKIQNGIVLEEVILPEFEIAKEYDFLQVLLESQGYSKIPQKVFEKAIPEIIHLEIEVGRFTFFNAFFANTIGDLMY